LLEDGGIIIYPTDTIYAMGCDIPGYKSIEKIAVSKIKSKKPELSLFFTNESAFGIYNIRK